MGAVGNKVWQEISFAFAKQFRYLLGADILLQNYFAGAEITGFIRSYRFFTNIIHAVFVYGMFAFRALPQGSFLAEIHRFVVFFIVFLAEIKFQFVLIGDT